MALFCIFMSTRRHPSKQTLFARFSSARTALYTVPVQFRDMFRGKVGLRHGVARPKSRPVCSPGLRTIRITTE
ncbi:hypothetical protein DMX06_23550 [Pseudomonas mosselii]|nr:hypothetical protein DMX06_23550 [Pseudomonas mosselii]